MKVYEVSSTNGRWGVQIVTGEGPSFFRERVQEGTLSRLGCEAGFEVFRFTPGTSGTFSLVEGDAKLMKGGETVLTMSLQSGDIANLFHVKEGDVWKAWGYARRSAKLWTLRGGKAVEMSAAEWLEAEASAGKRFLGNAFSLGMLPKGAAPAIRELEGQPDLSGLESVVGHADTAAILGVAFNRVTLKLSKGDVLIVAQLDGPRLPEGATALPEGASFRWFEVKV